MLIKQQLATKYKHWSADPANTDFADFLGQTAADFKTSVETVVMLVEQFDWAQPHIAEIKSQIEAQRAEQARIAEEQRLAQEQQQRLEELQNQADQIKTFYDQWKKSPTIKTTDNFIAAASEQFGVSADTLRTILSTVTWIKLN